VPWISNLRPEGIRPSDSYGDGTDRDSYGYQFPSGVLGPLGRAELDGFSGGIYNLEK
jgi:hypothetical protein